MAAPTDVRVEANSTTTAIVRWTDNGTTANEIFRSLDDVSYAIVGTVSDGVESFTDTELEPATRYWYKISNDNEGSFSSTVNVITHTCVGQVSGADEFAMPVLHKRQIDSWQSELRNRPGGVSGGISPTIIRDFEGFENDNVGGVAMDTELRDVIAHINDVSIQVEEVIRGLMLAPGDCLVCASNGAVVIDCHNKDCTNFIIIADQDINSITVDQSCLPGSDRCTDVPITFIIPAGTTRSIDGWPAGCGFDGDEGHHMPVSGGTNGRSVGSGGTSSPPYGDTPSGGTGGGGGGAGCNCVPGNRNQLTIKCCSEDCSLNCQSTKELKIKVCGGLGPYNIAASGSMLVQKENGDTIASTDDVAAGATVVIKPPANTGSAVAGTAYTKQLCFYNAACTTCNAPNFSGQTGKGFGCDDVEDKVGCGTAAATAACSTLGDCTTTGTVCQTDPPSACEGGNGCKINSDFCAEITASGTVRDTRTAGMITDGCNPCGLSSTQTITVTDATGTSVVETVSA